MTANQRVSTDQRQISARELERRSYRRRRSLQRGGIAAASTVIVFTVIGIVLTNSPGWPRVQATFFDWHYAKQALPDIANAFLINIALFLIAEVVILVLSLLVAIIRVAPVPALMPIKIIAVVYTDVLRGTPTILVIFLIGFGLPALQLRGIPSSLFVLGLIALTLSYTAYVSEVLRAGIVSVHPSQWASGRSLGLSYVQTLRAVILPQAFRRVTPPLINDFVSLQKDTALVSVIGLTEALRQAQIYSSRNFNFTPYVVAALFFIVVTIPFARLTDALSLRAARRQAGAL